MELRLAEGHDDAENGAHADWVDAHGNQDSAVENMTAMPDFFVSCIQDQVRAGAERTLPQGLEFERGGTLTDLGGTHGMPAEPILVTFRVEAPWIYISAIARLRALSLRMPFSRELG